MVVRELEQILLQELGFRDRPELKSREEISWPTGRAIPDIHSAFFLKNVPIAYFSRFSEIDPDQIRQLHKNVWSQSKAPLLFVTLPHEIRVYNGYSFPDEEDLDITEQILQNLTGLTDHLQARQAIQHDLIENHYERVYLETGAFWDTQEGQRVNHETRADKQLVESMGQMRELLLARGLDNQVAYTLLGRSIFIRYLEDREALPQEWIAQATQGKVGSYREALAAGRAVAYQLFEALSRRFNGDLFPVRPDETSVTDDHLDILLHFLNRTRLDTGQLSFLPYNFAFIPIELISHIYDTFIDDRRTSGAYYTPLMLADFVLEETMSDEVIHPEMTVLDPACGSGIFLVGAFRRLVQAWRRQHQTNPTPDDLNQILQENIFGIDKKQAAVRIAAFSLYLEILNHLNNAQIQETTFRFPPLQGRNLLTADFFAEEADQRFAERKFDRIVGNLPWGKGTLTTEADDWLQEKDYTVGGKQIAPAFMLRTPTFAKENGEVALLAPAKSTIFVTSGPHQEFREALLTTFQVRAVVNFSALVYELFPGAISPAVAFFYSAYPPTLDKKLVYAIPKPSPLSNHLKAIVLDTSEIKFLDRKELLIHPHLWKTAQWGSPRDAVLIARLNSLPSLREQAEQLNWTIGEGIQIGGGDENPAPWLEGMSLVPTAKLRSYFLDESVFETIENKVFHRPRVPKLTEPPLALIHQSQCVAAFSRDRLAYRDKITGIAGAEEQERLLLWLVAYINSPLAKYYHFLTSTSWGVERGTIIQKEYEEMPFLIPDRDDPRLEAVLQYLAQIEDLLNEEDTFFSPEREARQKEYETAINQLVYELYGLHPVEQQQVEDTLTYSLGFFEWAKKKTRKPGGAEPVKAPDGEMLKSYADVFVHTATSMLRVKEQTLNATVYKNGAPLTVVSFDLVSQDNAQSTQVIEGHDAMRAKLRELDEVLLQRKTPSIYIRRHVRVYDGKSVSLVRPGERRFWTRSQARADADSFLAELSSF